MRSRLEPLKKFVRMLRGHLDGVLAWTKDRLSSGAVEGMNNKIKSISHRSFGFRTGEHFIAAIYPLAAAYRTLITLLGQQPYNGPPCASVAAVRATRLTELSAPLGAMLLVDSALPPRFFIL